MTKPGVDLDRIARQVLALADATYEPTADDKLRLKASIARVVHGATLAAAPQVEPTIQPSVRVPSELQAIGSASSVKLSSAVLAALLAGGAGVAAGFALDRDDAGDAARQVSVAEHSGALEAVQPRAAPPYRTAPENFSAPDVTAQVLPAPSSNAAEAESQRPTGGPSNTTTDKQTSTSKVAAVGAGATLGEEGPAPSTSALWAETQLLQRAQRALASGNPQLARALLDQLAEQFPRGVLVEERAAARILSDCALGDVARARAASQRFFARYPDSVHAARLRSSCAATPVGAHGDED